MATAVRSYAPKTGIAIDQTKTAPRAREQAEGAEGSSGYDQNGMREDPLEWDDEKLAKHLWKLWDEQDPQMQPREARWKANRKRRAGVVGVQVIREEQDKAKWIVYSPPGSARVPPTFNKAARLCRRLVSNLMVDPPVPECEPGAYAENADPDAAEAATRLLQPICGPKGINLPKQMRRALNKGQTYDSGFLWFKVDPHGGGQRPKSLMASKAALTVEDAVYTVGPDGSQVPQPRPYVTRFVAKDGKTLTDDEAEALPEWLPRVKSEVLTGMNFRFVPETVSDIEDAEGGLIVTFQTLGVLKKMFPEAFAKLKPEEIQEMVQHRPQGSEERSPTHIKEPKGNTADKAGEVDDDAQVATLSAYFVRCPAYPKGGYFVLGGDKFVLHRESWVVQVKRKTLELPIPVAQFKGFEEGEDDPYGRGLMWLLGSGNEVRASIVGTAIEHLYRFNSAKTFYTPSSLFQPKHGQLLGPYVAVQEGTEPKREEIKEYPKMGIELLDRSSAEMDDEASLMPASQGAHEQGVDSGLHAQKLIEQVNVNLSDVKQSAEEGFIRSVDIVMSLVQAFYTTPQKVRVLGDDNEYKLEEFSGADLAGDFDIKIQKGTMTMLAPSAKLALAEHGYSLGMLDTEELKRIWSGNVGGSLGVQDYPPLVRVRGQIQAFLKGPPPKSSPELWPQIAAQIWERLPSDYEPNLPVTDMKGQAGARPGIAMIRFMEISRATQTSKYRKLPPEWQAAMEYEYVEMGVAAGVPLNAAILPQPPAMAPGEEIPGEGGVPPVEGEPGMAPAGGEGALPGQPGAVESQLGDGALGPTSAPMDAGITGVPVESGVAPAPTGLPPGMESLATAESIGRLAEAMRPVIPPINVQPGMPTPQPRPSLLRMVRDENGQLVGVVPLYDEEEVPA
jgi:hypothetical protein